MRVLEEQDLGGRWDLAGCVEERLHQLENDLETYKVLSEPSDLVPVAWIMSYQHVSQKRLAVNISQSSIVKKERNLREQGCRNNEHKLIWSNCQFEAETTIYTYLEHKLINYSIQVLQVFIFCQWWSAMNKTND